MTKTIVVCGYGSGISDAVARKFGAQGFQVALVARNRDKLAAAAAALGKAGITAKPFPTDLADAAAVTAMVAKVRAELGPITVIHYNAYLGGAGDLTSSNVAELRASFDVAVTGLVVAVQGALADLKSQPDSAVLVTGGGLAFYDPKVDAMAVAWNAMGLAVTKAAQHKAVGLLAERLRKEGVYVGEGVVMGAVKGTAFDAGQATLEASTIANKFWDLYQGRSEQSIQIS
ncbi:MAG: Short-chain dehydrogenase/reductase [Deltaproteobacteria bacterium]|nr:Short-chain dehydrogenase/reductase [Deltaproteobacteria bacterium]